MRSNKKIIFGAKKLSEKMKISAAFFLSFLLFFGAILPAKIIADVGFAEGETSLRKTNALEIQENLPKYFI